MARMTRKQQNLLYQLANTIVELEEQCEKDFNFHEVLIENNISFPFSLDEWALRIYKIVNDDKGKRINEHLIDIVKSLRECDRAYMNESEAKEMMEIMDRNGKEYIHEIDDNGSHIIYVDSYIKGGK